MADELLIGADITPHEYIPKYEARWVNGELKGETGGPCQTCGMPPEHDCHEMEAKPFVTDQGLLPMKVGQMSDGMSYAEAYWRASSWWDKIGKLRVRKVANKREEGRRVSFSPGGIMLRRAPELVPEMTESGIMMGRDFDHLTMRERARVVIAWHQEHIVNPQIHSFILPE